MEKKLLVFSINLLNHKNREVIVEVRLTKGR